MKNRLLIPYLFVFVLLAHSHAQEASDQEQIRLLFEKVDAAWTSPVKEGIRLWKEITGDAEFTLIMHDLEDPDKTVALDRKSFLAAFEKIMNRNPSIKHNHATVRLNIYGAVAYETGTVVDVKKNGNSRTSEVFSILVKEYGTWRILLTTSAPEVEKQFE